MNEHFEQAVFKKTWHITAEGLYTGRQRIEAGTSVRVDGRMQSWTHAPSWTAPVADEIIQADAASIQSLAQALGQGFRLTGTMESHARHIAVGTAHDQQCFRRYVLDIQGSEGGFVEWVVPGFDQGLNRQTAMRELESAIRRSERLRRAQDAPTGWMPVVIGSASGALVIHEACGHLLEASFLEQKATPFEGRLGTRVTNLPLTIVDDPEAELFWGQRTIDDEGVPTRKIELIKDGILQSFLNDGRLQKKNDLGLTGSARRESFAHYPAPRMSCTYLQPGANSLDALLDGIDEGLYIDMIGGGTVLFGKGAFNFSVESASLIRKGRITEPVRGAFIASDAQAFLNSISAVGNNLEFAPLMCGGLSGTIPTSIGQPAIKVDAIRVGK